MKKITIIAFLLVAGLAFSSNVNAQGFEPGPGHKQLNFGIGSSSGWGTALFAGMDFGIADRITIGPWVGLRTRSDVTAFTVGFRGDYHYGSHIPGLPSELDLWGGLGVGYTNVTFKNDFRNPISGNIERVEVSEGYTDVWFRAGGRWFFSPNWGAMAEVTGASRGDLAGAMVGLSYKF